ncbi:hypothetical protein [Lacimicrobium sp. SS2-24]|uniref:hypothetical protein n=1 Tax=Lacimicrobium sp. SS2-24 TaxID=2005569 RepID=UPI0032B07AB7
MSVLPSLLFKKRTDLVVLDYYIFHYYAEERVPDYEQSSVRAHALTPVVPAYAAFHDQAVRDKFNQALLKFIDEGRVPEVIQRYVDSDSSALQMK